MDKNLIENALSENLGKEIEQVKKLTNTESDDLDEIYNKLDEFITQTIGKDTPKKEFLIKLLQLCYDLDYSKLNDKSVNTLLYAINRRKEDIINCYKEKKKDINNIKDDDNTIKMILAIPENQFFKLLELLSTMGLMVQKLYGGQEQIGAMENELSNWKRKALVSATAIEDTTKSKNKKLMAALIGLLFAVLLFLFFFKLIKNEKELTENQLTKGKTPQVNALTGEKTSTGGEQEETTSTNGDEEEETEQAGSTGGEEEEEETEETGSIGGDEESEETEEASSTGGSDEETEETEQANSTSGSNEGAEETAQTGSAGSSEGTEEAGQTSSTGGSEGAGETGQPSSTSGGEGTRETEQADSTGGGEKAEETAQTGSTGGSEEAGETAQTSSTDSNGETGETSSEESQETQEETSQAETLTGETTQEQASSTGSSEGAGEIGQSSSSQQGSMNEQQTKGVKIKFYEYASDKGSRAKRREVELPKRYKEFKITTEVQEKDGRYVLYIYTDSGRIEELMKKLCQSYNIDQPLKVYKNGNLEYCYSCKEGKIQNCE